MELMRNPKFIGLQIQEVQICYFADAGGHGLMCSGNLP